MRVHEVGLSEVILDAIEVTPGSIRKGITQKLPVWTYGRVVKF